METGADANPENSDTLEKIGELGEAVLRLENYRYRITSAMSWVVFGMTFASFTVLYNVLLLLGAENWIAGVMLILAGVISFAIYSYFWKFVPVDRRVRKKAKIGIAALVAPFVVSYSVLPLIFRFTPYYFSVIWYPSLGLGLLLASLGIETSDAKTVRYAGILMGTTSLLFLAIPRNPVAANLLAVSMMLLVYLLSFAHAFLSAYRSFYERA